jgi:hypothetical protein
VRKRYEQSYSSNASSISWRWLGRSEVSEGRARPSRIKPETIERESQVLKLRRGGLTFDLIAKELGFKNASGAHKAYVNACKRIIRTDVEDIRGTELDRLDMAQGAIWSKVMRGEIPAIMALMKIMDRRARLLGLDAPTKIQAEVVNYDAEAINGELRRIYEVFEQGTSNSRKEISMGSDTGETEPTS